jgi:hypothetical protein
MYDFCDFEIGARFLHNKTGAEWTITKIGRISAGVFSLIIQDPGGRSIQTTPAILENLYSPVEPDPDPEPVGILPIGSIDIEFDGTTPPPALGSNDELLLFKRSGRPRVERPPIDSYFGEARKLGPRRKENE